MAKQITWNRVGDPTILSIKTLLETAGFCWISNCPTYQTVVSGLSEVSRLAVAVTDCSRLPLPLDQSSVGLPGIGGPTGP